MLFLHLWHPPTELLSLLSSWRLLHPILGSTPSHSSMVFLGFCLFYSYFILFASPSPIIYGEFGVFLLAHFCTFFNVKCNIFLRNPKSLSLFIFPFFFLSIECLLEWEDLRMVRGDQRSPPLSSGGGGDAAACGGDLEMWRSNDYSSSGKKGGEVQSLAKGGWGKSKRKYIGGDKSSVSIGDNMGEEKLSKSVGGGCIMVAKSEGMILKLGGHIAAALDPQDWGDTNAAMGVSVVCNLIYIEYSTSRDIGRILVKYFLSRVSLV